MALAIHCARYASAHGKREPDPFTDKSDREYAYRLTDAALSSLTAPASAADQVKIAKARAVIDHAWKHREQYWVYLDNDDMDALSAALTPPAASQDSGATVANGRQSVSAWDEVEMTATLARACCHYPGEDQAKERAAFYEGAAQERRLQISDSWSKISKRARDASGLTQDDLADIYNSWISQLPEDQANPHPFKAFLAGIALVRTPDIAATGGPGAEEIESVCCRSEGDICSGLADAQDELAEMRDALTAERERAEKAEQWAKHWHRVVETILTICGLSSALGGEEALEALRDHLTRLNASTAGGAE